jgi:hypothetical protein
MYPPLVKRSYVSGDGCDTITLEFNNGYALLANNSRPPTANSYMVFANLNPAVTGGINAVGPFKVGTGAENNRFMVGYHYEEYNSWLQNHGPR